MAAAKPYSLKNSQWWREQITFLFKGGKAFSNDAEHQRILIRLVLAVSIPTLLIFSTMHWYIDHHALAILQTVCLVFLTIAFFLAERPQWVSVSEKILMACALSIFLALIVDGGVEKTGIYWAGIYPFFIFALIGLKQGWKWVGMATISSIAFIYLWKANGYPVAYTSGQLQYFISTFLFYSMVAAVFEMLRERRQCELMEANRKLKEARTAILKSNEQLEKKVEKRTSELRKSYARLKDEVHRRKEADAELAESEKRFFQAQKMEAMGTLVGGIAHDFNNMLSGINANLFMIKRETDAMPKTQERIKGVEHLIFSASDMIRQLLTFARKDHIKFQNFDLVPFMNEAFKLAEVSIPSRIKFRHNFHDKELWIKANGTQVQQVAMNLINNARDAVKSSKSPQIAVDLSRFEPDEVFRQLHPELQLPAYARLSISDNGCGIEEEQLSKIFEPFFTTKEVGKGTGLGLAMCYGAIQSHGGTIDVDSEIGRGTTFNIYLPLQLKDESRLKDEQTSAVVRGNGETVLIADDDPILGKIEKEALQSLGYRVLHAANGRQAVEMFEEHCDEIDLVILDVMMPLMGGVAAAKQIRKIKQGVHVIYITGYDPEGTLNNMQPNRPDDFILDKPFTVDELSQAIRKQLLATIN